MNKTNTFVPLIHSDIVKWKEKIENLKDDEDIKKYTDFEDFIEIYTSQFFNNMYESLFPAFSIVLMQTDTTEDNIKTYSSKLLLYLEMIFYYFYRKENGNKMSLDEIGKNLHSGCIPYQNKIKHKVEDMKNMKIFATISLENKLEFDKPSLNNSSKIIENNLFINDKLFENDLENINISDVVYEFFNSSESSLSFSSVKAIAECFKTINQNIKHFEVFMNNFIERIKEFLNILMNNPLEIINDNGDYLTVSDIQRIQEKVKNIIIYIYNISVLLNNMLKSIKIFINSSTKIQNEKFKILENIYDIYLKDKDRILNIFSKKDMENNNGKI